MMKKPLVLLTFLLSLSLWAQKTVMKLYDSENYSITIPEIWKVTNDDNIVNIFPDSEVGAITISEYHNLELPKSEVKKFILALYQSPEEDENKVKDSGSKKGFTQYSYEHADEKSKLFWNTRVYQKNTDLYLVTINCEQKYWNGNYMKLFNEAFESFKIKK